jgi:hypothetical protein
MQQVNNQLVLKLLSQQNTRLALFPSELFYAIAQLPSLADIAV